MNREPSEHSRASGDPSSADTDADVGIDSHAFVIRIWLEEVANNDNPVLWRGQITHVLDRQHRYFQDLPSILSFIEPYLEQWQTKQNP